MKEWCIPKADADFVAKMEDVLEVYQRPYDLSAPVIKCKKTPRKKCRLVAEEAKKR